MVLRFLPLREISGYLYGHILAYLSRSGPNGFLLDLGATMMSPAFCPYQSETIGGGDLFIAVMRMLLYCPLEAEAEVPAANVRRPLTDIDASPNGKHG